jgi:hypothetical protein
MVMLFDTQLWIICMGGVRAHHKTNAIMESSQYMSKVKMGRKVRTDKTWSLAEHSVVVERRKGVIVQTASSVAPSGHINSVQAHHQQLQR